MLALATQLYFQRQASWPAEDVLNFQQFAIRELQRMDCWLR